MEMDASGMVRRTDLYLRTEYPDLITIIYRIEANSFKIYCEGFDEDFEQFQKDFDYSIKMISAPVTLTQEHPNNYIETIPQILDSEISKGFEGIGMTLNMISNVILAKFPKINFLKIEQSQNRTVTIFTKSYIEEIPNGKFHHFLNTGDRKLLEDFLEGLKMPVKFEIIDKESDEVNDLSKFIPENPIQTIEATKLRNQYNNEFSKRDEALWFDKIDTIFEGSFKKENLYFFNPNEYSCYVDYSAFKNIDLRNHLFLFETVYITLPYDRNIVEWLKESKISKNEFLDLIIRGRVKLILTQPEFRYDISFIKDAFNANPNAVITRRAIAALHQIDIVEMSNNYLLNEATIFQELKPFCQIIADIMKVDMKFYYNLMVWPIKARRKSFEYLLTNGGFSTAAYGVNNVIEPWISNAVNKDLAFEFTVNSESIHLANALNATYFPFHSEEGYSDQYYANAMGDLLNFYKNANKTNIATFVDDRESFKSGVIPINPIDIIEVNDFITIAELESELAKNKIFPGSKNLIDSLAPLSIEDRQAKINYYNNEVVKNLNPKKITPDAIDLGTNIIVDSIGAATGLGFLGTAYSMLKNGAKGIDKITNLSEKLESAFNEDHDKSNIHYLTKINRVAKLKRYY